MNKRQIIMPRIAPLSYSVLLVFGLLNTLPAFSADALNVILKNNSSSSIDVELIDQYGGNFTASVDAGMGSSQTLKTDSEIKVRGATVHVLTSTDEGKEIVIAN